MSPVLLVLLGCEPWDLPEGGSFSLDDTLWDRDVAPAIDGVYVRLPASRALARIKPDGAVDVVDLDGASPDRLVVAPGGQSVLAFASWPVCKEDDDDIRYVEDCPDDDLEWRTELELVRDGARVGGAAVAGVSGQYNATTFATDAEGNATIAALYLDLSSGEQIDIDGVLNLTEVVFLDLATGVARSVSVGFAAESVVFADDGQTAVVLSRSQVAVVALSEVDGCADHTVCVTYNLSLDADQAVQPSDVALLQREGERYALVSVEGKSDLYILDLANESIDIQELAGVPSDVAVDAVNDRTVIVYGSTAQVDVLEHEYFEVVSYELDEPMSTILEAPNSLLLYNDQGRYKDVYHLDVAGGDLVEERAENPVTQMELTEAGYAVATLEPESGSSAYDAYHWLEIFPLPGDGFSEPDDPRALALQSAPVGLATVAGENGAHALLLLDDVDTLLKIDLATALTEQISLEEPPAGIAAQPGTGKFVVTHDVALGMITFVDPATGENVTAAGFATANLVNGHELPRRGTE